jgi:uncharacterized protein YegP (UPF0339 family)/outer membrane protein OmpA-like peptidoglycan-associated protein
MSDLIQQRDDDYLKCSDYFSTSPDDSGIHRFDKEGKYYFSFIENARVILRSEAYSSESGRENGIASVLKNMANEDQYVTKQTQDGKWVLSLKAANHQEIARSCPQESEDAAKAFLPSARINYNNEIHALANIEAGKVAQAGFAFAGINEEDDYLVCGEYEEKLPTHTADEHGIVSFTHENTGKHYFAWVDKDGKILMRGEGYPTTAARDNGIQSVLKNREIEERYGIDEYRGVYFTTLKAGNHQEIARSCPYKSEAEARSLFPSERAKALAAMSLAAAPLASVNEEDDYMICREYQEKYNETDVKDGFISFKHENTNKYYFAWVNKNGEVIMRSEGYPTAGARDNGLESVKKNREIPERFSVEEQRGLHYLVLKAGNHQEIARSCPKESDAAAWALIKKDETTIPLAAAAPVAAALAADIPGKKAEKEDDYLVCDEYKGYNVSDKNNNIAFFKHKNGQFYFVVYNRDGSVRLRSEGFKTPQQRDNELREVIRHLNDNKMYEYIEKAGYRIKILKDKNGREVGRSCPEKIGAAVIPPVVAAVAPVVATAAAEPKVAPIAPVVVDKPGFNWWWLLPLLLLIPLLFWAKSCCKTPDKAATTAVIETPVVADTQQVVTETAPAAALAAPSCDLNWILFDFDKYDIRPDANSELQVMANILKENPTYKGVLKAHTDAKGSDEYNQRLSENRANAAKKVLVGSGIDGARIETSASSEAAPIAKNTDDDSGRKFNRRVELYVLDANGKEVCKSIPPAVPADLKGN